MDLRKALANERKRPIWKICVRYPGCEKEFAPEAIARGFVAVGWIYEKDLQDINDREEIKEILRKKNPREYRNKIHRRMHSLPSSFPNC